MRLAQAGAQAGKSPPGQAKHTPAEILIFAKVLAQGRSLTVAALLVGSTVCSQQNRDRQGALRDPNLQIFLQRLIRGRSAEFYAAGSRISNPHGVATRRPSATRRYSAARASRNQSIISETGKLRTGKFFGKSLLRSHKKSSREETISSDTDRLKICATIRHCTYAAEHQAYPQNAGVGSGVLPQGALGFPSFGGWDILTVTIALW
jgi:hypothetical protein